MWKKPDRAAGQPVSLVACPTLLRRDAKQEVGLQISLHSLNQRMCGNIACPLSDLLVGTVQEGQIGPPAGEIYFVF